ncbi:hypothetical protein [Deinococcus radiotolerans]|uniref:Uncharacterized protein n=1 Tax=Deinococcus radiotolerans TaxID=1309407 RepID=A0ABQ2FR18_9DEIO|nr:hypothetical protein [Deinococcus radiotolerans]GGL18347.1 hypothetical protein GCM10010844_41470 [Deinococcus radiotolerans]
MTYSAPLDLVNGTTVTVMPWPYLHFAARYAEYRKLLRSFRERAVFNEDGEHPQDLLIERVVTGAVESEADRAQIHAADIGNLLQVIHDLNRLDDVAAKPLSLYQRLLQAESSALETPGEPTSTTSPT